MLFWNFLDKIIFFQDRILTFFFLNFVKNPSLRCKRKQRHFSPSITAEPAEGGGPTPPLVLLLQQSCQNSSRGLQVWTPGEVHQRRNVHAAALALVLPMDKNRTSHFTCRLLSEIVKVNRLLSFSGASGVSVKWFPPKNLISSRTNLLVLL